MSIDLSPQIQFLLGQYLAGTLAEETLRAPLLLPALQTHLVELIGTTHAVGADRVTISAQSAATPTNSADVLSIGAVVLQIQRATQPPAAANQTNISGTLAGPALTGTFLGPVNLTINQTSPEPHLLPAALQAVAGPNQIAAIRAGFQALYTRMHEPLVYAVVVASRDQFAVTIQKLRELNFYKELHEFFHQLEDNLRVLDDYRPNLANDPGVWRRLARQESDVYEISTQILRGAATAEQMLDTPIWLGKLSRAQANLRASVEEQNPAQCAQALALYDDLLGRVPDQLNGKLVSVVENLPFANLSQSLEQIVAVLEGTASQAVDDRSVGRFFEAVAALNTLGVRVVRLVADHNAFQEIENELRGLADDLAQLRWSWPLIFERQQRICSNNPASWAAELANGARDLESAVALGQPEKLQISFDRYQSRLKRNFVSTDKDLLTCCETLRQIAPSLALVFDAAQ